MNIFIDGDASRHRKSIIRTASKYRIPVHIYCDNTHMIESDYAYVHIIDKGKDMVDFAIVNSIVPNDIVITKDYGLAAMCLAKKAFVINERGYEFTEYNINGLLTNKYINYRANKGKHKKYARNIVVDMPTVPLQKLLVEVIKKSKGA